MDDCKIWKALVLMNVSTGIKYNIETSPYGHIHKILVPYQT